MKPTPMRMLAAFHERINQIGRAPRSGELPALRKQLIREEVAELLDAIDSGDRVEIAREAADVLYVVYGTAVEYGIDLDGAFSAVHAANMRKLDNPRFQPDGKLLKPEGYTPPDLSRFVAAGEEP